MMTMQSALAITPDFKGVARFSARHLRHRETPPRYHVASTPKTSTIAPAAHCIDLEELAEALAQYYAGALDMVDATRVNAPLSELVPGKPLLSVLESSDICAALKLIGANAEAAIIAEHCLFDEVASAQRGDYVSALDALATVLWPEIRLY